MQQGDHEHLAFEKFCEDNKLDNTMHPLHLLYLNKETSDALKVFKAGYTAGKEYGRNNPESNDIRTVQDVKNIIESLPTELRKKCDVDEEALMMYIHYRISIIKDSDFLIETMLLEGAKPVTLYNFEEELADIWEYGADGNPQVRNMFISFYGEEVEEVFD